MKINPYSISQKQVTNPQVVPHNNMSQQDVPSKPSVVSPDGNLDALKTIYSDKELKKLGFLDCQTCAERRYVDGSDDPSVSFKTPTQIDPEQSAAMVMSHELEHVANEQANAEQEGREVVSQSVKLHSAICPE